MNNSVVVFFFTSSNYLSNVKTLQSIYQQDYPHIRLIVCNDCTYGFENERLLNNFEFKRPQNIEHIVFQENPTSIGEYRSQSRYWERLCDDYIITLHSGEKFKSSSSLRTGIQKMKDNPYASALVCDCEFWNGNFGSLKSRTEANTVISDIEKSIKNGIPSCQADTIYDCMIIYRLSALSGISIQADENETHIGQKIIPQLIMREKHIITTNDCLCAFSESSINPMLENVPDTFGNQSLDHISQLLQEAPDHHNIPKATIFQSTPVEPQKSHTKKFFLMLLKLSTVSRILMYAGLALMLFIASGLFLNLKTAVFSAIGMGFLIFAVIAVFWAFGMLVCNLYLKKNPQRLVM